MFLRSDASSNSALKHPTDVDIWVRVHSKSVFCNFSYCNDPYVLLRHLHYSLAAGKVYYAKYTHAQFLENHIDKKYQRK